MSGSNSGLEQEPPDYERLLHPLRTEAKYGSADNIHVVDSVLQDYFVREHGESSFLSYVSYVLSGNRDVFIFSSYLIELMQAAYGIDRNINQTDIKMLNHDLVTLMNENDMSVIIEPVTDADTQAQIKMICRKPQIENEGKDYVKLQQKVLIHMLAEKIVNRMRKSRIESPEPKKPFL